MKDHHEHKSADEFGPRLGDPASGRDGAVGPGAVVLLSVLPHLSAKADGRPTGVGDGERDC
jgi:hypothetical protein